MRTEVQILLSVREDSEASYQQCLCPMSPTESKSKGREQEKQKAKKYKKRNHLIYTHNLSRLFRVTMLKDLPATRDYLSSSVRLWVTAVESSPRRGVR